ncbi:MAG: hypothetical protein JWM07_941 [Candidatus Saccharibacteria bacterium]|nr:hypothetical protein [Candidatus Saccharibacteria bacterium]
MSEQLDRQRNVRPEYAPARLEKELGVQDYMRSLLQLGATESQKLYSTEQEARTAIERLSRLIQEQLGEQPMMSNVTMRVTGDNVKLADTTIDKNDLGDVTIKTSYSLLGEYATRLFQYSNMYGELHRVSGTDQMQPQLYICGLDVSASNKIIAGDNSALEVRVSVDPTLLIPCEEGVELHSLVVEQTNARMTAMEELMAYSDQYPALVSDLTAIEQEVHNENMKRPHALKTIDKVRQMGESGKIFSTLSDKHSDALNTAIAEVFTANRVILIRGAVYMYDDENGMIKHDMPRFFGKVVDVVDTVPMCDEPTGQALALSTSTADNEKLSYVPLSQIDALYI